MQAEQVIEPAEQPRPSLTQQQGKNTFEQQSVMIPPNRMTPLKNNW